MSVSLDSESPVGLALCVDLRARHCLYGRIISTKVTAVNELIPEDTVLQNSKNIIV